MSTDQEGAFHRAMVGIYDTAKREAVYNATRFLQMISEQGGLSTAKQLLNTTGVSDGFTALWMAKRLDLTVEAHVLEPEFQSLFTPDELVIARSRLSEYGYRPEPST